MKLSQKFDTTFFETQCIANLYIFHTYLPIFDWSIRIF